mmetsp:Transcript_42233/g.61698  ORF Transcript_42233/g.61698 Transcript_42233/m.61698 type:complete len:243 (-) Transcript_42233:90-818(-)
MNKRQSSSQEEHSVCLMSSRSSAYAGPTPLGADGLPLKSCLSSFQRRCSNSRLSLLALSAECEKDNCCTQEGKQSVSFGAIEVRTHERMLGDHPCVSDGAPVTLGWKYNQQDAMPVDKYERARGPTRQLDQLRIPREMRVQILLEHANVPLRDVKEAELSTLKAQEEMRKSMKRARTSRSGQVDEMKETARRRLRQIMSGGWKKQEEEELWRNAHDVAVAKFQEEVSATCQPSIVMLTPCSE